MSGIQNQIIFVKNLSYSVTSNDLYTLFGKYGPIIQIRLGTAPDTKGTCYVVYESAADAKTSLRELSGYNFQGRYLVVLPHSLEKMENGEVRRAVEEARAELEKEKEETDTKK